MTGAASPFSTMLGQGGNFMGMDGLGGDIDWVSFDFVSGEISAAVLTLDLGRLGQLHCKQYRSGPWKSLAHESGFGLDGHTRRRSESTDGEFGERFHGSDDAGQYY